MPPANLSSLFDTLRERLGEFPGKRDPDPPDWLSPIQAALRTRTGAWIVAAEVPAEGTMTSVQQLPLGKIEVQLDHGGLTGTRQAFDSPELWALQLDGYDQNDLYVMLLEIAWPVEGRYVHLVYEWRDPFWGDPPEELPPSELVSYEAGERTVLWSAIGLTPPGTRWTVTDIGNAGLDDDQA